MYRTTIHIRFFRRIYCRPKRSDIDTGIKISIHIVSAVIAFKYLPFPIAYMVAIAASFACISWFYQNNRNSTQGSFVGNVLSQLIKRPLSNSCSKLFTFFQRRKSDTFQIFQSNSFIFFFCNLNNLFSNRVVNYRSCCTFSTTKPFQEFFTCSCAFALNGASYFLSFFSIILKFFRVKFFSITKGCQRHQTKITTDKLLNVFYMTERKTHSSRSVGVM